MSSSTLSLKIYDLLNAQFGEPERARAVTESIEQMIEEKVNSSNKAFESLLSKDLEILRADMERNIVALRSDFSEKMATQLRWIIGLFIPLYLSIIGLVITLLIRR